jgi:hypothetical protein
LEEVIVVYGLVSVKSDSDAPPCALRLYWVFVITEAIEVRYFPSSPKKRTAIPFKIFVRKPRRVIYAERPLARKLCPG